MAGPPPPDDAAVRMSRVRQQISTLPSDDPMIDELADMVTLVEVEVDRLRNSWADSARFLHSLQPRQVEADAKRLRRGLDAALTERDRASIQAELDAVTARYETIHGVWDQLDGFENQIGAVVADVEELVTRTLTMRYEQRLTLHNQNPTQDFKDRLDAIEAARAELEIGGP